MIMDDNGWFRGICHYIRFDTQWYTMIHTHTPSYSIIQHDVNESFRKLYHIVDWIKLPGGCMPVAMMSIMRSLWQEPTCSNAAYL